MATYTVTTLSDAAGAPGLSLREALASADANPGADAIAFADDLASRTIVLQQGGLTIASDVTIDGGDLGLAIDANSKSRVLNISGNCDVELTSLAITGGVSSDNGAGIVAGVGTRLLLINSLIEGNHSQSEGGGIWVGGDVFLRHTTVRNNSISAEVADGAGICAYNVSLFYSTVSGNTAAGTQAFGGGIATGDIAIINSTIANNVANGDVAHGGDLEPAGYGGGVFAFGKVSILDSTLTGNRATSGGGAVSAQSVTTSNAIIVGNASPLQPDIQGEVTESNGHNLFGSDVNGNVPGDLESVAPKSVFAGTAPISGTTVSGGVLSDHGGPTETVELLDASTNPALGRGEGLASITTDQRGEPRPSAGGHPDIGAFELEQSHATVVGTPGVKLLQGTSDSEALLGLAHAKVLHGGGGDDLLDGGKGADRLRGGPGGDVLIGGGGPDRSFSPRRRTAPRPHPT
jgi:RTX calcium-binding nonapeptide repeat (4 copies)